MQRAPHVAVEFQVSAQPKAPDAATGIAALLIRVRGEFLEMPGLRLTIEQCVRLWSLDRETCEALLRALVEAGFLCRDSGGRYARTHRGY
jgi:hypothetical protein